MIKHCSFVLALAWISVFSVLIASSQDKRIDVFTPGTDSTRFGPAMLCDKELRTMVSSDRSLRLSLVLPDKQTYGIGETAVFEITVKNSGNSAIAIPHEACSKKSSLEYHSGVLEACVNLNYMTPTGENDWFTGPCLCGREDDKDLTELQPGQSVVIRGGADIVVDADLFSATYRGERPTLILQPDISFSRQHFPPQGGKTALDGCIDDLPTQVEAQNSASLQVMATPHDKNHRDAPTHRR
jgi:hypothetical protein